MGFRSPGRVTLGLAGVVLIVLAASAGWGHVGAGDGALYRMAAACAESAPGGVMVKRCFAPDSTGPLFPTLVLGVSTKITGMALGGVIRFYGVVLGLVSMLLVWQLSRGRQDWMGSAIAVCSLLFATPLLERVRSGGVEVWILALVLILAKLLADSRETMWKVGCVMVVALLLFATHPYAAWASLAALFVPMCTPNPEGGSKRGGRVWFGWFGISHLSAVFGGIALFAVFWPGFQGGRQLWLRLVGVFRGVHPPFRFGGEVWVQALDVSAPPFYATAGIVFLSTSVVVILLIIVGILGELRDEKAALKPLLLLALAWLIVNSLQGSPFADGYDHRLPLLGLLIPFVGRGFGEFERFCAFLVPWPSRARAMGAVAVLVGLSANVVSTFQGRPPSSGLAPDSGAMVQMGGAAFMRPAFEPGLIEKLRGLPTNTKLACSPWEDVCRREIIPGINALSGDMPRLRAARFFDADVVVIPNDPAYITPPVLLQDFSGGAYKFADVHEGAWLRYAVRKTRNVAKEKPAGLRVR